VSEEEKLSKKKQTKPWTDLEKYALIKSDKRDFPMLAVIMGRTVEELREKWDELVKEEDIINDEEFDLRRTKRDAWYFGKDGFERWIIEKILQKKWLGMPSYAMHYLLGLSEEERERLRDQWLKETKDYIEELGRKGLI
jgi:hypothetical protein